MNLRSDTDLKEQGEDSILRLRTILKDFYRVSVDNRVTGLMNLKPESCSHHLRNLGPLATGDNDCVYGREAYRPSPVHASCAALQVSVKCSVFASRIFLN